MMPRADHRDIDPHVLAGRLNTGWLMCDREPDPDRKHRLEDHWIDLLHRYEAVCAQDEPHLGQKPDDRFSGIGGWT